MLNKNKNIDHTQFLYPKSLEDQVYNLQKLYNNLFSASKTSPEQFTTKKPMAKSPAFAT